MLGLLFMTLLSFKGLTKVCSDFQNSLAIWTHWWGPWRSTAAWPISSATFARDCAGCASMPTCCSGCTPISSLATHHATSTRAPIGTGGTPLIWESSLWLCLFRCFFLYLWNTEVIVSGHYTLRAVYLLSLSHFSVFSMHFTDPTILLCLMEWQFLQYFFRPVLPKRKNGKQLWEQVPEKWNKMSYIYICVCVCARMCVYVCVYIYIYICHMSCICLCMNADTEDLQRFKFLAVAIPQTAVLSR